jgi:hypothetical protein
MSAWILDGLRIGQAHSVLMWNSEAMDVVFRLEWVNFGLAGLILGLSSYWVQRPQ